MAAVAEPRTMILRSYNRAQRDRSNGTNLWFVGCLVFDRWSIESFKDARSVMEVVKGDILI